jgi:hypothetical protein
MAFNDSSVATMTMGSVMTVSVSATQTSAGCPRTALGLCSTVELTDQPAWAVYSVARPIFVMSS